jgi:ketosteroid isomerase-like protein
MNVNEEAVAAVLANYQAALDASDTDSVMPLSTEDGVFMPPDSPSAVGAAGLRRGVQGH